MGQHRVACWPKNSAVDIYGHPAISPLESWDIAIRVPTVATASFTKLVDKLKCGWVTERVLIPGHWVKVRRHGKLVRIYRRAHWVKKRVLSCHPRLVRTRERVHGHWRVVRVPVFPHLIQQTVRRIAFGKRVAVAGWLGATSGQPLGGQLVRILTSPYPGPAPLHAVGGRAHGFARHVERAATRGTREAGRGVLCRIAADRTERLPRRPVGGARQGHDPAAPIRVRWAGKPVVITGRLWGGWIPTNRQEISQLLELHISAGRAGTAPIGITDVQRDGRFRVTYRFCSGRGVTHWSFWVSSLSETDYPYAASRSASSRPITVGPRHGHQHACRSPAGPRVSSSLCRTPADDRVRGRSARRAPATGVIQMSPIQS